MFPNCDKEQHNTYIGQILLLVFASVLHFKDVHYVDESKCARTGRNANWPIVRTASKNSTSNHKAVLFFGRGLVSIIPVLRENCHLRSQWKNRHLLRR